MKAKRHGHAYIEKADTVLYLGVGAAGEVESPRPGQSLTLLDRSQAMLKQAEARLGSKGVRYVCQDLFDFDMAESQDVVVTNFFLNIVGRTNLERMMDHITPFIKKGGYWLIADFAPPPRGLPGILHRLYWYGPLLPASLWTGEEVHPFYDYVPLLRERGLKVVDSQSFGVFSVGPAFFRTIVAQA